MNLATQDLLQTRSSARRAIATHAAQPAAYGEGGPHVVLVVREQALPGLLAVGPRAVAGHLQPVLRLQTAGVGVAPAEAGTVLRDELEPVPVTAVHGGTHERQEVHPAVGV